MKFKNALEKIDGLGDVIQPGVRALKKADKEKIHAVDTAKLACSVDLDRALADACPNDARWDYGIGWRLNRQHDKIYWVEVHPATEGDVGAVIAKKLWLVGWIDVFAPHLKSMSAEYVWIASGRVSFNGRSPQRKRLAKAGIKAVGRHLRIA